MTDFNQLRDLLNLLREYNVQRYETPELRLELGPNVSAQNDQPTDDVPPTDIPDVYKRLPPNLRHPGLWPNGQVPYPSDSKFGPEEP